MLHAKVPSYIVKHKSSYYSSIKNGMVMSEEAVT